MRSPAIALLICVTCASSVCAADRKLSDVVHVGVYDGIIRVEWVANQPPLVAPIDAQGPESIWRIRAPRPTRGMVLDSLTLERPAGGTTRPDDFWFIGITSTPDQFLITANRGGKIAHDTFVRMIQRGDGSVILAVAEARTGKSRTVDAKNLIDLRARHPAMVREYVIPWLMQLAGENLLLPGAADVYRAFDEIAPEPRTVTKLQKLLPRLSASSFVDREEASRLLDLLGPDGVCAILHMNRADLPPETAARLDAQVSRETRRPTNDPAGMRNDIPFLADCMEFDDPRIRAAAKAQIEKITGRPIPMMPVPTAAEWSSAAEVVRGQFADATASNQSR